MATTSIKDWNDRDLKRVIRNATSKGMRRAVKMLRDEARADLGGAPNSAPGQPPGKVDGDLVRSVKHKVKRPRWGVQGIVGIIDNPLEAAKGARLAEGFAGRDSRGRVFSQAPRPWLAPVVERNAAKVVRMITEEGW